MAQSPFTWQAFWLSGEKWFDRFYTVSLTFICLHFAGELRSVSLWLSLFFIVVAFVGQVVCGVAADIAGERRECE